MSEIIINGMVFDGEVDDDGGFVYCTMNFETNLLIESVNSGECLSREIGSSEIKKLDTLKKRSARAERIQKKDFMKLNDNYLNAKMEKDNLAWEIQKMEFRFNL